ncbi:unnamed protein product [Ceutorhynchus assimilis]|uniref:DUF4795 domain-containing protein n=1 Tax=Ceutorhynchus assimilis TaxID=467358 RepID=A0A9N9MY00_9CUCU|nr:unnamed protein product [Ceutorhynchus assimilis]
MAAEDGGIAMISLPQLVDLALNSPEVGIVNFTMLHAVLQVIVHQLNLGKCNIEFSGSDGERLQNFIKSAKPGPIIKLTEYTVDADGKERKQKIKKKKSKRTVDRKDDNQKEMQINIIKTKGESGKEEAHSTESSDSLQTIILVEPASKEKSETPQLGVALTKDQLKQMTTDIKTLQDEVKGLKDLPSSLGLIEACRNSRNSTSSNSPILDMFQILTLVKRLDATELVVTKMASMIEDLAQGQTALADSEGKTEEEIKEQASNLEAIKSFKSQTAQLARSAHTQSRKSLDDTSGGGKQIQDIINHVNELEAKVNELAEKSTELEEKTTKLASKKRASFDESKDNQARSPKPSLVTQQESSTGDLEFDAIDLKTYPPNEAIAILQREILSMKEIDLPSQAGMEALKEVEQLKQALLSNDASSSFSPDVKVGQIEIKLNELKDQLGTMDTVDHQQFADINTKLDRLEQEIAALWERINLGLSAGGSASTAGNSQVQDFHNKMLQLQEEIHMINKATVVLVSERDERQTTFDMMNEQIELLKTVKADREDLEDALADKADACQINRKVSHEQFDAAYEEVTKSLEATMEKLATQETLWVQSLADTQRDLGNKLDKMELGSLKEFIDHKLKAIQDRFKKMSSLKQEHEAAGTKTKILRNVNCISCDADVVMKKTTDITMYSKPYAMPAAKSPGPYLAYEMDLLRKQQKGITMGKNLNVLEAAMGQKHLEGDDHICNRYCGGSHTVTTSKQRVIRLGHFLKQWGPEIAPVQDVPIKGTDGRLYKGRDDTALRAAALERPPSPKVEAPIMNVMHINTSKGGASQEILKSIPQIPSQVPPKKSVRSVSSAEMKKQSD